MITPIREMTINQIMKRKDDLLVSGDDINEIATNVRNKVIDNFVEKAEEVLGAEYDDIYCKETIREIAEQLRG